MLSLHNYQQHAVDFAMEKRRAALFLPMGMGKTAIALHIIDRILEENPEAKVLVVSPLSVARAEWVGQPALWPNLKRAKFTYCLGSADAKREALDVKDANVTVINREGIVWLTENFKWRWDTVIIDESSSFKSVRAQRTKALKRQLGKIKNIFLMSGTPAPNRLLDLYAQIFFIDRGLRLGKTYHEFVRQYFIPSGWRGLELKPKKYTHTIIKDKIKDICFSLNQEDYIELPEKLTMNHEVAWTESLFDRYEKFKKEKIMRLLEDKITALSAASLTNKLLQFCNGNLYDEDRGVHPIHELKLDYLKELIDDNPNENFLVAYNFISDKVALMKKFPGAVLLDTNGVAAKRWNRGEIKLLITHPARSAYGLNLQAGGSNIIWYGMNWSYELYTQFNARLHRQGQTQPVKIHHLIMKETIERRVVDALVNKHLTQKRFLDAIVAELRKML